MESKLTHVRALVFIALVGVLWPVLGHAQTDEDIYAWTCRQMGLEDHFDMPPIRYVDRAELKQVFVANNKKAYMRWESEYGPDQAEKILRLYLNDIIGMYDVNTGVIYVGQFLSPCRRRAILAHEITHYLQLASEGSQPAGWMDADALHATREMEAYKMEERFSRTFCYGNVSEAALH